MTPDQHSVLEAWLKDFLRGQGGVAGTVHVTENDGLDLAAAVNIPPPVIQAVTRVPRGKGMAGLAMERDQPIQTCNLKDDASGVVRPGAKAVDAQAAVAMPVHDAGGRVRAVVGIAFAHEREFSAAEIEALSKVAEGLP